MCAISARHSPLGRTNPANAGNAFLAKAHELVVPLLRMPTTDGVTGLILLAWAEHGQNSESGFWVRPRLPRRRSCCWIPSLTPIP